MRGGSVPFGGRIDARTQTNLDSIYDVWRLKKINVLSLSSDWCINHVPDLYTVTESKRNRVETKERLIESVKRECIGMVMNLVSNWTELYWHLKGDQKPFKRVCWRQNKAHASYTRFTLLYSILALCVCVFILFSSVAQTWMVWKQTRVNAFEKMKRAREKNKRRASLFTRSPTHSLFFLCLLCAIFFPYFLLLVYRFMRRHHPFASVSIPYPSTLKLERKNSSNL